MPRTVHAELNAHIAGRRSFAIHGDFITYRDAMRMRGDSRKRPTVLVTHECFETLPFEHIDSTGLLEANRIIAMASKPAEDEVEQSPAEEAAMFLISKELNGLIIEPAPF